MEGSAELMEGRRRFGARRSGSGRVEIRAGWRGAAGIDAGDGSAHAQLDPRARKKKGRGNEDWRREWIRMARIGRGSPARATRDTNVENGGARCLHGVRQREERDEMVQWQFCNYTEVQNFTL